MTIDVNAIKQRAKEEQATGVFEQVLASHTHAHLLNVHTAMPGIIDSFDPDKQTATVKPAIKTLYAPDDDTKPEWQERTVCKDVPVIFPGSGDYMLTFPVQEGDECLLIFAERSIDYWHDKGDVQEPWEMKNHSADDAIAIVGLRSKPNIFDDFNNDYPQLRNKDGDVFITLNGDDGVITVQAGTDTVVTIDDSNSIITAKADTIKLDGDVEISGNVRADKGAVFHDDVTAQNTSVHTHVHTGVQSGGATTGPPQ